MPANKLEKTTRSRNLHKTHADKIITSAKQILSIQSSDLTDEQLTELRSLYPRLQRQIEEIKKKDAELEDLIDDYDKMAEVMSASMDFLDNAMDVCASIDHLLYQPAQTEVSALKTEIDRLAGHIGTLSTPSSPIQSASSTSQQRPRPNFRLPVLELPSFDGDVTAWTNFSELFNASIVKNDSISDIEKLQYLKSALRGEAAQIIQTIPLTGANFSTAWNLLGQRYENTRAIIRTHIQRIVHCPAVRSDDPNQLKRLWHTFEENRRALRTQNVNVEEWDTILVFLASEKMDSDTRRQWELTTPGTAVQTYEQLRDFLESRVNALTATTTATKKTDKRTSNASNSGKAHVHSTLGSGPSTPSCVHCKGNHFLHQCSKFTSLTVDERTEFIKRSKLCFNCMRAGHVLKDCSSKHKCRQCNVRHHTLLHREASAASDQPPTSTPASTPGTGGAYAAATSGLNPSHVVLPTAIVPVSTPTGTQSCRAMLDSGSQLSFISDAVARKFRLKRESSSTLSITGIGNSKLGRVKGTVRLSLPVPGRDPISCSAFVLPQLTSRLPSAPVDTTGFALDSVTLADPRFHIPAHLDMILGMDVYNQVVMDSSRRIRDELYLRETVVGWMVSGVTTGEAAGPSLAHHTTCVTDPDFLLRRFWEIEDIPSQSIWTADEKEFEEHFKTTTTRDDSGRLVVKLPFRQDAPPLGNSLHQATKRFHSTERRLGRDPKLRASYISSFQESMDNGFLEPVPTCDLSKPDHEVFYLPHHPVFKDSSTTTKMRIVFDGSAKTDGGPSLNESLLVGPTIQDTLTDILFRFRFHRVALSADVGKMYNQIKLSDDSKDFHRVLWRSSTDQPLQHYRMTRVTFGVGSSAFHATRGLHELASHPATPEEQEASRVIKKDLYVDDLLSGAPTIAAAAHLQDLLIAMLAKGGFPLRKWSSNVPALVERLPPELRETTDELIFRDDAYNLKTLGILWKPVLDVFLLATNDLQPTSHTKRALLSDSASFFDPLGWLAPCTLVLKTLLQRSWITGLGWDEDLPEDIVQTWDTWREEIIQLKDVKLDRCVLPPGDVADIQLHVFCDASELAYAAVIYSRVTDVDGNVAIRLLASKTKVSPVKTVSLPRLELCAAQLGARLVTLVQGALRDTPFEPTSTHAWSDSTVALAWISKLPRSWTTFVANRVSFIQDVLPPSCWNHVPTADNPADCASRGLQPSELLRHNLWWNGPPWLMEESSSWPALKILHEDPPEKRAPRPKPPVVLTAVCSTNEYSSWIKLKRVTAFCLRFIHNLRSKERRFDELDLTEIEEAETRILQSSQLEAYPDEIQALTSGKTLSKTSALLPLAPFLDKATGLLRVGGRLQYSTMDQSIKQPILVSADDPLASLIILDAHRAIVHGANSATLAKVRQRYWIPRCRDLIQAILRRCVTCRRFAAQAPQLPMAPLPPSRVTPSRPFTTTGVDFGGPLQIKMSSTRNSKTGKAYIALFICFVTKAVHLELVTALSTEAFISTLRRFVSRRGLPHTIHSDNGTNFVGAANEMKEIANFLKQKKTTDAVRSFASTAGINWSFIPPRAPHFGGLWEAGIKRVKHHLRRAVGTSLLHFEELYTVITQVEAMINSRPLTPISNDANDFQALTPGHFLVGAPLNAVADPPERPSNLGRRWRLAQEVALEFWKRWSSEYLPTLQPRGKWRKHREEINEGDLVLLSEDNIAPLHWPLARVTRLIAGPDGISRVADITTASGQLRRPLVKLRQLLPLEDIDAVTSRGGVCSDELRPQKKPKISRG